jgi:tetratricopeptide (TPR) repeat protein
MTYAFPLPFARPRIRPLPAFAGAALAVALAAAGFDTAAADAFADGKIAMKSGRYDAAIVQLQQAIAEDPMRTEAHVLLGQAHEKRRHWDQALAAYDEAARLDPRSAEAQRGRGAALSRLNRLDDSVGAYQAAMELDRKFPEAALGLADVLVLLQRYDEAVAVLTEGTTWGAKTRPLFNEGLGRTEAARGNVKEAEVYLLRAREEAPAEARYHRALGDLYVQRKVPSLAVVSYEQAIALDGEDLDSRLALARALTRESRYNDALDQYKEIIARDSTYADAYLEMGDIYLRASENNAGFIDDAMKNLDTYRRLEPTDPRGTALLARAYYRTGKKDEARALLDPLAKSGELPEEGQVIYGRLQYDARDWPASSAAFAKSGKKLEELDYMRWADALGKQKLYDEADAIYRDRWSADSTANKPPEKSSDWILQRGKLRYAQGRADSTKYAEAAPFFERKIELDPKSDEAYYYLGLSRREQGRMPEALAALQKANELSPIKPDRRFWLGATYLSLKNDAEARTEFQKVAELDSTSTLGAIARQRLGFYYLLDKQYDDAIRVLEASVVIDPKQVQSWVWLGQANQNAGNRTRAVDAYRKALELDPANRDAKKGLEQLTTP